MCTQIETWPFVVTVELNLKTFHYDSLVNDNTRTHLQAGGEEVTTVQVERIHRILPGAIDDLSELRKMRPLAVVVNVTSRACVVVVAEAENIRVDSVGEPVELADLERFKTIVADHQVVRRELDVDLEMSRHRVHGIQDR